jgi:hypothetical protein
MDKCGRLKYFGHTIRFKLKLRFGRKVGSSASPISLGACTKYTSLRYKSCAPDHIPPKTFFWQLLEAEIIQQTQLAHPLPSPYMHTQHAGVGRCGGMHPRGSPEAPLKPRRKVGPPGPIKLLTKKKTIWGDMIRGA